MEEKITKLLSSFGISISSMYLLMLILVGITNPTPYLISTAIGTLITWPLTYIGIEKINQKSEAKNKKQQYSVLLTTKALHEIITAKDQIISQKTTNFYYMIKDKLSNSYNKISLNTLNNINDLLYLINANYYEQISHYLQGISREELANKILDQVNLYLEDKDKKELKRIDINNIINNCYFIINNLKKEIIEEYKLSEVKMGNLIVHGIENKNEAPSPKNPYQKTIIKSEEKVPTFDKDNLDSYKHIVERLIYTDTYLCEYGNTYDIEWDYEALMSIVRTMIKEFHSELIKNVDNYSNFALTCSYIYNIMCYSIMNHKAQVSYQEMLNVFKEWEYIPFSLRLEIVSTVIEKLNLVENNPFGTRSFPKKKGKILIYKNKNQDL